VAVRVMVGEHLQGELQCCSAVYVVWEMRESCRRAVTHTSHCYNIYLHHYEADDGQDGNHAQSSDAAGKG
jgi:hypothetical protein